MKFLVKFKNFNELICNINDTNVGCKYYNLTKETYNCQFPVYRDSLKFNKGYLNKLAIKANKQFNWSWDFNNTSSSHVAQMHKDIEILLAKGFEHIPAEFDEIIHDLHYGLHLNHESHAPTRRGWMQIEWYNGSGFPLEWFPFKRKLEFGDLRLQNPYVGHGPLQIYFEKDFQKISQTCKFHDFVKPGINIITQNTTEFNNTEDLISKFKQNDPKFVEQHGVNKILDYTGYPIIGNVENKDLLEQIINYKELLELESIEFA